MVSVFERLSGQEVESEKLKSMQPLKRLPKVLYDIKKKYKKKEKKGIWNINYAIGLHGNQTR